MRWGCKTMIIFFLEHHRETPKSLSELCFPIAVLWLLALTSA
jgi:hypothetical protein